MDTATAEYRGEQDRLKQFLDDCLMQLPGYTVQAAVLYQVYRKWCEENGERYPLSGNKFGREIAKVLPRVKTRTAYEYQAARLTDEGSRLLAQALGGSRQRYQPGPPPYEQQTMSAPPKS